MTSYEFLTELSCDPHARMAFRADPGAFMDAAGLEPELREQLCRGFAELARTVVSGSWSVAECVMDPSYDPPPPPTPDTAPGSTRPSRS